MRTTVRSRFRPILGFSSLLVFLLLIAVTASSEDASTSSSFAPMESSSSASTTEAEAMTSVSVSEDTAIASTTELSTVASTTEKDLPECRGFNNTSPRNLYMECKEEQMVMKKDNQQYHTADFSTFTQDDFEQMLQVKNYQGNPMVGTRKFKGNMLIQESAITNISNIIFVDDGPKVSLIVKNNLILENVSIELSATKKFLRLEISGNKKLSNESLNHLKNLAFILNSSYIQDFGECDFNNAALITASQLEGCHYIKGDLFLNGDTKIDALQVESLKNVTGCIKIENSKVTNVDLIKTIEKSDCTQKHVIRGNKDLCLHPEDLDKTRKHFEAMGTGQNLIYENNMQGNGCKGKCSSNYIKESNDKTCIIITDDLLIENIDEKMDMSYLHQVEEIQGSLRITGTSLKNVTLFPNLKTIVFDKLDKGSAIYIQRNKEMTYFDLPKLTSVVLHKSRKTNDAFLMEYNGNYTMDEDLAERFINLTQTDKVNLPIFVSPNDTGNGNQTVSVRRTRRKNETDAEADGENAEDSGELAGKIVGGVLGVLIFVVVLVAVIVIITYCVRKKKQEARQKKLNEEVLVKITIQDLTSLSSNVITTESDDKCDTVVETPSVDENQEMGIFSKRKVGNFMNGSLGDYFRFIDPQFPKQKRLNVDITYILGKIGVTKIKIKRDDINFEAASKIEPETMKTEKKKIWTHNPRYSLYGIRPRKEVIDEIWYDHGEGPFDPHAFIENCMKSSAVSLKYRTIMAALDYVMKNKRFGNPHDPTAPPKQLIEVTGPIHIVGDTHGSLIDLQMIFSLDPEKVVEKHNIHPMLYYKYLFTGDYIDRGIYDTTVFAFLTVLATLYPARVFLLRGNHEWIDELGDDSCTAHCRCNWLLDQAIAVRNKLMEVSCWLPIAARINERAFAVHGGIGHFWPNSGGTDDLRARFDTLPMPMCMSKMIFEEYLKESCFQGWPPEKVEEAVIAMENLLWNDPQHVSVNGSLRGVGGYFNKKDVDEWNKQFDMDVVIRAHQEIGFYNAFGGKLISLFGSFDTGLSKVGVPYMFSDNKCLTKIKNKSGSTESTAVLRIDSNNRLHFLLMRHIYEKGDKAAAPENIREMVTKFDYANQKVDKEWNDKIVKKNADFQKRRELFGKQSGNAKAQEKPNGSGEKSGVMSSGTQSVQSGMGSVEGKKAQKKGKDASKEGKSKKKAKHPKAKKSTKSKTKS